MSGDKFYWMHHVDIYNTPKEKELLEIMGELFPTAEIENPNQKIHSDNYQEWKKKKGNGMLYFTEIVLADPTLTGGIITPFEDRMYGAGVFKEATFLQEERKLRLFELTLDGTLCTLGKIDKSRELSVPETRKRVYGE